MHLAQGQQQRAHSARVQDERRGSAAARGYDRTWQRLRLMKLRATPLCESPGCDEAASEVDHVVPLEDGGERLDELNLQSLCGLHHRQKTARDVATRRAQGAPGRPA